MARFSKGALWVCVGVLLAAAAGGGGVAADQDEDIPHNEVKNWALKFGVDLWEFGRQFTKMNEIQRKYHDDPLEVVRKDGLILIREMALEVKNMMDFKMSAVKRIMDSAEQAALSALDQSESAQAVRGRGKRATSDVTGHRKARELRKRTKRGDVDDADEDYFESESSAAASPWQFSEHFDNTRVNVTKSEALITQGVNREDPGLQAAIRWSSHLEPLFASNYETDPALSWQYLGTSAGALRRYPASDRNPGKPETGGIGDFRSTRWYIDAATSPKDVAILLDVTSHRVSRATSSGATVAAILDSLGDDDFVNVYAYSGDVRPVATCLGGGLVSAHADNKRVILNALNGPREQWSDVTAKDVNLTKALDFAFDILYRYNRTGAGCQCNQAMALVSPDVLAAPRGVFQKHNWPHMPVRVFAYDVGKDKTTRAEMHWMACNNKGFYSRVTAPEEAPSRVLDFISVMARPMVMYQNDHPIQWSPVFVAGENEDGTHRLMTSVSTPVFDRRNHTVRVANLLGVAGTDVPIEQIKKLVPEYKLGVNGYSFIVNNNGHVLYHPGLNPLLGRNKYLETLKPTYTSVDLTEVELPESENSPRENHSALLDLRRDMIEQKEGETEFGVKTVYDSGRRVATRRHKYFYERVDGTPFSLGVALPEGYGMYELRAELEIRHSSINVTEYFKGNNWRIHPDWVYCEYASSAPAFNEFSNSRQTGHESDPNPGLLGPPERRLLHFLSRAGRPGWKWMSVRPRAREEPRAAKTDKDGYFCDKTLVQSLVRDAMVTDGLDRRSLGSRQSSHKEDKQQGYQMFGVSLSFVATRSGLLRWTEHGPGANNDIDNPSSDSPGVRFAQANPRPTQSTWYRRAVDQHSQEPESFVFSVDFADDEATTDQEGGPVVTVAHAVFVEHKGHRAPAAVVGLQFKHSALAGHFVNITSACTGLHGNCRKTCASEELDCYLLDNNGFVLLSEDNTHTGRFFGEIDGTIMDSLVQDRIFKRVAVFDYQGTCTGDSSRVAGSSTTVQPHWFASWLKRWLFLWARITTLLDLAQTVTATNLHYSFPSLMMETDDYQRDENSRLDDDEALYDDYEDESIDEDDFDYNPDEMDQLNQDRTQDFGKSNTQFETANVHRATITNSDTSSSVPAREGAPNGGRPCDLRTDLYVLQPDRLNTSGQNNPLKGKLTNCHVTGCERPFSVQKIPHSNLILLVVDTLCPCGSKQLHIRSAEITPPNGAGSSSAECARSAARQHLFRRRPPKCISYHPEEIEIQQCGGASAVSYNLKILILTWTILKILLHAQGT